MSIDPPRQSATAKLVGLAPIFADSHAMAGGEKSPDDAAKPEDAGKKPEPDKPEPDLDEELDESFPASDPPASTQP